MKLSELSFWWQTETKQYNDNDTTLITRGGAKPTSDAGALRKSGRIDARGHSAYGGYHKVTLGQVLDGLDPKVDLRKVLAELKEEFSAQAEVRLNKEHTAIVTAAGIQVGCQKFNWDILDKLAEARKQIMEG